MAENPILADLAPCKNLITSLPAVINAEFVVDKDSKIAELHVLADQSRSPKQIVRDIQSALMAQFKLEVDHKLISIAQIPSMEPCNAFLRRPICNGLDLSLHQDHADVGVTLFHNDKEYKGHSSSDLSKASRLRSVAQATVEALNLMFEEPVHLALTDVRTSDISGQACILVSVNLKTAVGTEMLLGCTWEKDDINLAVVKSVLDAVNRRICFIK